METQQDTIWPLEPPNKWAGQTSPLSYGLCIDSQGSVWTTQWSKWIHKYASDGKYVSSYTHTTPDGTDPGAQGCVVGLNDDVWVAHSMDFDSVGHIRNDGTFIGNVVVGNGPTGVAVDGEGKIWATNYHSSNLSRIDPTSNGGIGEVDMTVELGSGCSPYNYGDMTGSTNTAPPDTGTWAVTYDHEILPEAWGRIQWNQDLPGDSTLTVQVRTNEADPWTTVSFDEDLSLLFPTVTGQYLYVQVLFTRATSGESPVLKDLSITFPGRLATDSPSSSPTSVPTTPVPTSKASKAKSKSKSRSTGKPTRQPTNEPTEASDAGIRK